MSPQSTLFITILKAARFLALFVFLILSMFVTPLFATSIATGTDQFGRNCDLVTWTDSTGNPRTVWIVNQTPGSFISKMTYYAGGSLVTATVPTTGFAFCTLVNHYYSTSTNFNDNYGGNYTSDNGASNPASTQPGGSTYVSGAGVTRALAFTGTHHLIWQGTFQMYAHPWESNEEWYITVQYAFMDGRDDFIFSNAYDSGAIPQANLGSSNLAPYDDFSYDGVGNSQTDPQSGIGFGTNYKFATNYASGASLSASTGWTYNVANTVPYAWMYKDATKTDREMGEIQNQPYNEKDAGYNAYWAMTAPPSTGVTMPSTLPFQMNEFASYVGMRFTWGTQYTAFQNNHTDGQGAYGAGGPTGSWGVYPINASSFNILVDQYTNQGVPSLVTDTENIYKSTLTAAAGTVVATGPKGPGNYLSPQTGSMPTMTYSHPGFDFVLRRWRVTCSSGTADVTLNAGGTGLYHPTLSFENIASAPCTVTLNGAGQVQGTDYYGSYDAANSVYYVTFLKTLAAGANEIVVKTNCGPTATFTSTFTPCLSCSPTPTPSPTASFTSTLTPTLTPPCSGGLLYNGSTSSTTNLWGGNWSTYAGTGSSTANPSPFVMTAPGNGTAYCANMYGNSNSAGYPSLSTFLNSSATGVNISSYNGLQFWFKGDGGQYQVQMHATVEGSNYNDQYYVFTPPAGWSQVTVPFSSFQVPSWGPAYNGTQALSSIIYLTWIPLTAGSYNFSVDTVQFTCPGPPPATNTPTLSSTPTPSATNTPSPSATSTGTLATATFTYSPTITPTNPGGIIQPGKHICFIGDSITYRGNYVKQVENYLNTIFPTYNLTYTNVGVGGWTATQFLQYVGTEPTGLQYVLNTVKPDIATICFGMNDANYQLYSTANLNQYINSMTSIITQLQAAGIQVVLLSNGIVDQTVPWASNTSNIPADYNTNTSYGLAAYANWVMGYGSAHSIPAFNVLSMATTVYSAARSAHSGYPLYTDQPQDGIHPNPSGGLIYAYGLLKALGAPTQNRTISLMGTSLMGSIGASVGAWTPSGNGGSFTLVANPMPYVGNPQAKKILPFMPFQQTFNNIYFTASGLSAANYYIVIDGYQAGPVSSSALSSGVNLCDYWINPPTSPSQSHTVQLVDASTLSTACYNVLIDDMEKSNDFPQIAPLNTNVPWPENLWGGWWWAGTSNGSTSSSLSPNPFIMTSPGYNSTFGANLSGPSNLSSSSTTAIMMVACYTQYDDPKNGIQFMFKGTSGQTFRCQAHTEAEDAGLAPGRAATSYDDYGSNFTATGSWQQVTLPYSAMTQSWAPTGGDVFTFDPGQIEELEWIPYSNGTFNMSVDNVSFYCTTQAYTPTVTNTPTKTMTYSPTPAVTSTNTPTNTATQTATNSSTNTSTNTATNTATSTLTNTATNTATNTLTATATNTFTATITNTATNSPTVTVTNTGTINTPTITNTPTATMTFTMTNTPTLTATATITNTPTMTFTLTSTFTSSFTPTLTDTGTATNSATNTCTNTATNTATNSYTVTDTPTVTNTPTASWTPTNTNSATATNTLTDTPTVTNTRTASSTPTNTNSSTATATQTNTSTKTFTPTSTATWTSTSTETLTFTPTSTLTVTPTAITGVICTAPYPNPATTGPIEIDVTTPGAATIEMDVFSTAFRKVISHTIQAAGGNGPLGTVTRVQWDLRDRMGMKVADGLYYIRIHVSGGKSFSKIFKVLVLR